MGKLTSETMKWFGKKFHGGNGLMVCPWHWFYRKRLRLYAQSSVKNCFSEVERFLLLQLKKRKKHVRRFNLSETMWFCELKSLSGFGDCNVIGSFWQFIHKVIGSVLVIKFMLRFQICDFRQEQFPFLPPHLACENMLNSNLPAQKGLMSFLYEILLSLENHYIQKIKSHCENKLKIEWTEDYRGEH